MPFSWDQMKKDTVDIKIARAIAMAKTATNSDFKILHPDWIAESNNPSPKFTDLKLKVKAKVVKFQDRAIQRRKRTLG